MTEYLLIQNVQKADTDGFFLTTLTTRVSRRMAKTKEEAIQEFIKSHEHIPVIEAGNVFCLEMSEIPLIV